jgi:DNA replication protein DnaC
MNDETKRGLASFTAMLDRMIADAPDEPHLPEEPVLRGDPAPMSLIDQIAPCVAFESLYGFPSRYAEELENDRWFDTFRKAKGVVERGGNVMLCGARGGGKTRMAYELARRAVLPRDRSKPQRIFKTAMRIFVEIRSTYRRDSKESELEIMDRLETCRLLVVDELQERGETDFECQKLTSIIDARYRHKLPTILIANLTPEDFSKTLGPSICDRCNENGGVLEFSWPSFRK